MNLSSNNDWQIAASVATVATVAAAAVWLVRRHRPTAEEIERARRQFLVQSGRLVDGMLLDIYEVDGSGGQKLTFLLFNYRIAGVDYECSQEITAMHSIVDPAEVRAGFPCTVRYQPGNPQNSIVIAEGWSGLRDGIPRFPSADGSNLPDRGHRKRSAH